MIIFSGKRKHTFRHLFFFEKMFKFVDNEMHMTCVIFKTNNS